MQLPAVAWQWGGYSHRMSPRVTWVWRRSRRRRPRGRTTLLRGPRTSQPPSPFCRNYLPSLRSLPGSLARNLAEQRSAPNSTTPRYGSPAPSTCLAREALLLRQLRYSTGQRAPACFYTPYRAYLAAAGTRTYAPPPPQPRGAPSAAASPARRCGATQQPSPFFESPESPRQRMKPWPGYRLYPV